MPRLCTICRHPGREEADRELLAGRPLRDVARRLGSTKDSVARHKAKCIAAVVSESRAGNAEAARQNATDTLAELVREARRLGKKAEKGGDLRAALAAVRELVRIQELTAKLSGALSPEPGPGALHLHVTADQATRIAETFLARRSQRALEASAREASE